MRFPCTGYRAMSSNAKAFFRLNVKRSRWGFYQPSVCVNAAPSRCPFGKVQKTGCLAMRQPVFYRSLRTDIGQKCDLTGALDSLLELALMLCACSGNTAGKDLSALADISAAQTTGFLVIDVIYFIFAKSANFSSSAIGVLRTSRARSALFFYLFIHYL